MSKYYFHNNSQPTIGVELELGLVDAESFALTNACDDVLRRIPTERGQNFKPELMQCCVEINTGVCITVAQARSDLSEKLQLLQTVTDDLGLALWWGATHPFSRWADQVVTRNDRYQGLVQLLQDMARRLITFGLHVHVGVDSGDKAVMICDRIMQHLPLLLSLSCSSPFWQGRDTGLTSQRSKVMDGLPTAGLPTLMRNWSEYVWLVNHMVDTGFINTIREIWWDVRPHHNFGTVEVRICDMPGNLDDVCVLAALVQCLVKKLSDEIDEGTYQFDCHPMMVRQNKWRASRFGLQAGLVNSYNYQAESVLQTTDALIDVLEPVGRQLECWDELRGVRALARGPSWADRQRAIRKQTGSAVEVVRQLIGGSRISDTAPTP